MGVATSQQTEWSFEEKFISDFSLLELIVCDSYNSLLFDRFFFWFISAEKTSGGTKKSSPVVNDIFQLWLQNVQNQLVQVKLHQPHTIWNSHCRPLIYIVWPAGKWGPSSTSCALLHLYLLLLLLLLTLLLTDMTTLASLLTWRPQTTHNAAL